MTARITAFDRSINLIEKRDFQSIVSEIACNQGQSALFCNVHMLMLSQEDKTLANAMDSADWVFADGVPVAWLQSKISGKNAKVIRGYEIMLAVCKHASRTGESVGFLGSSEKVLQNLAGNLCERFERLSVGYQYSPPFVKNELTSTSKELKSINDSQIKWLFVGLGCPKQEKWIAKYKDELNCNILGVGAAFDWISGQVKMPPKWMETLGLGWLYRLLGNPMKMWHRYVIFNSKFIFKVITMKRGTKKVF